MAPRDSSTLVRMQRVGTGTDNAYHVVFEVNDDSLHAASGLDINRKRACVVVVVWISRSIVRAEWETDVRMHTEKVRGCACVDGEGGGEINIIGGAKKEADVCTTTQPRQPRERLTSGTYHSHFDILDVILIGLSH